MKKESGGPVFPLVGGEFNQPQSGVMLRDLIAIAWLLRSGITEDAKTRSAKAYQIADAMIEARAK